MTGHDDLAPVLRESVYRCLRALARLVLRYDLPVPEFLEIAKQAFVDVAREDHGIDGRPTSKSRVAAMTGLSRKEVARLVRSSRQDRVGGSETQSRSVRVVSGWLRDAGFQDGRGEPRPLPVTGPPPSFEALVRNHSGDIPPVAMRRELERAGVVAVDGEVVRLLRHGYVPGEGEIDKLPMLGTDVGSLIATIDHNLRAGPGEARFQRKVAYRRLDVDGQKLLADVATGASLRLLEELNRALAPHALSEEEADGTAAYAGLGVYMFVQDPKEMETL